MVPCWCLKSTFDKYETKRNVASQTKWQSFVTREIKTRSGIECASACSILDNADDATKCNAYKFLSETQTCYLANVTSLEEGITDENAEKIHLNVKDYQRDHCSSLYQKPDSTEICIEDECEYRGMSDCINSYVKGTKLLMDLFKALNS